MASSLAPDMFPQFGLVHTQAAPSKEMRFDAVKSVNNCWLVFLCTCLDGVQRVSRELTDKTDDQTRKGLSLGSIIA